MRSMSLKIDRENLGAARPVGTAVNGSGSGNGNGMNSKRNMLAYDRSSTGLWVALIFLVSLNLRPAIAAVGPVLAQMGTDLAWGEGVQGVLTAIPLIAFAAVSPLVTFLARRIGIDSRFCWPCCASRRATPSARSAAALASGWARWCSLPPSPSATFWFR